MNEWQFTSDVAKWIYLLLERNKELPFGDAYCEGQSADSPKRRDLTIKDRNGRVVLTGEVKLPGQKDGATPYNAKSVEDARAKARRAGVDYFFTWNVNECVLWETNASTAEDSSHLRPDYKSWSVTSVRRPNELDYPDVQATIKSWLPKFLKDVADVLRGADVIERKSPDEKFIDALEAALRVPVALTFDALYEQYKQKTSRREIDKWMVGELGFTASSDAAEVRDNLDRAAKQACYALANKLVFYEALLKRYGATLKSLDAPEHINSADKLRTHFEAFFAQARRVTHDYETVFGENALGLGSRVPFYNDGVVPLWRAFVEEIHEFDFSRLDYEVIGTMVERLISPEERHKFGQFYTRVEVVDLINSFAIPTGEEAVMDPACGGGTFLVRAYARKRELAPHASHAQRLQDLYGVDVSRFATHLTTINLATRDLVDDMNYPQIVREDFFEVRTQNTFISLPSKVTSGGLGKSQHRDVQIQPLDAVVGNPPYVEQEGLSTSQKDRYSRISRSEGAKLTKRSDLHCYFWPHGLSFLKDAGYLCFITSSQWLDTDYGFKLQDWVLRHFEIVAVLESRDEPWFVGARVATTVTILRRQQEASERMNNTVRFVQIRKPMAEILAHDGTTAGAVTAADRFRDELLDLTENTLNSRYRARLVRQGDLWMDGVLLGVAMGKSKTGPVEESDTDPQPGEYHGGKWGVHVRAPDLWFDFLTRFDDRLAPLAQIADVQRGITTGKDSFFYPKDASLESLRMYKDPAAFKQAFGAEREEVESGEAKIVRCGEGHEEMRPIEARFLEPEVHSLMEVKGYTARAEDCSRMILLVPTGRKDLEGTHALRYIEWGEKQGVDQGSTVKGNVTADRDWYDLTKHQRGELFWPKSQQYRHFAPVNSNNLQCNCNLYDLQPPEGIESETLASILNSSVVVLSKFQYGRPVGVEGNLKTEVVDANMMRVPDPRKATKAQREHVAEAFRAMKDRAVLGFLSERRLRRMNYTAKGKEAELAKLSDESELTQADRRALDDAVLQMLGVKSEKERARLLDELYEYLAEFFEWTRQKEEQAIQNKKKAKKGKTATPQAVARDIFSEVERDYGSLLRAYDDFIDLSKPYDSYEVPDSGIPTPDDGLFEQYAVRFVGAKSGEAPTVETRGEAQRALLLLLVEEGINDFPRIPVDDAASQSLYERYAAFLKQRANTLQTLIEERTADPDLQQKVYNIVLQRIQRL